MRKGSNKQKSKKWLLTAGLFIAVAVLGFLLLKPQEKNRADGYSIVVSNRGTDTLQQVVIENEHGDFTMQQQGGRLICPGREDMPLDEEKLQILLQNSCEIQAEQSIRGAFLSLADYGLEVPRTTVKITYTDGTVLVLEIGAENEDGTGVYFKPENEKVVYLAAIETFAIFTSGEEIFLELRLSPYVEEGQETAEANEIVFTNAHGEVALVRTVEPYVDGFGNEHSWRLTGENSGYADDEWVYSLFPSVMQIKATEVYIVRPSAQDLIGCGITEGSPTLTIVCGNEKSELIIGTQAENGYYVYKKSANVIYIMPAMYYTFEDATIYTVATRYVMAPPREEVASISVQGPEVGQYFLIDILETGGGAIDGQRLSNSTFAGVYRMICSLRGEYILDEPIVATEGTTEMQIVIQYLNGDRLTVTLVPYDAKRCAIFINGEAAYLVRTAYVEKLMHTLNQITEGQIIDPTW